MAFGYLLWAENRRRWRSRSVPYRSLVDATGERVTDPSP
jgi:hypothetical protein